MRLFITGVSGMLGSRLARLATANHQVFGSYGSFPVSMAKVKTFAMKLEDEAQMRELVPDLRPEVIIHTAALTDVDECERNPDRAYRINVKGTENLAMVAAELRTKFVYISTDYVFDGKRGDYVETDSPYPVNVYGRTKLAGEESARLRFPGPLVVRTSIFGSNIQPKTGVVESVVNSLKTGKPMTRFSDQFSTPIYTGDLSRLILRLLEHDSTGLFHAGGGEKVSRYSFALKIAKVFSLPQERLLPAPFKHLEGLAERPRDSSLCGKKIEDHIGIRLPQVEEGLMRLKEDFKFDLESRTGRD